MVRLKGTRWRYARHALKTTASVREEGDLSAVAHEQRLSLDACLMRLQRLVQHLKTKVGHLSQGLEKST